MVKRILIGLGGIVAVLLIGFVALVAVQPSDFRITRSATMAAPAAEIFEEVNDLHKWQA